MCFLRFSLCHSSRVSTSFHQSATSKKGSNPCPRRPKTLSKGATNSVESWKCFRVGFFSVILDSQIVSQAKPRGIPKAFRNSFFAPSSTSRPPKSILEATRTSQAWISNHFWYHCRCRNSVRNVFVLARWRRLRIIRIMHN